MLSDLFKQGNPNKKISNIVSYLNENNEAVFFEPESVLEKIEIDGSIDKNEYKTVSYKNGKKPPSSDIYIEWVDKIYQQNTLNKDYIKTFKEKDGKTIFDNWR